MQKSSNRKKLRKGITLQIKNSVLILFSLALILIPFDSLDGYAYALEDDHVETSEEQTNSVDTSALKTKLANINAADLNEAAYTEASWQTFQDTVTASQSVSFCGR